MLSVRDNRHGRSKSPGGRERSRSRADDRSRDRSRDTRDRRYEKEHEYQKSSKRRDSDSRERKSKKKYYESESESDREYYRSKRGGRSRSDSEDSRDRRSKKKYYDTESDSDRGGRKKSDKHTRRHDDSSSHDDTRYRSHKSDHKSSHKSDHKSESKAKKNSKKHKSESESSESDSDSSSRKKKHDKHKVQPPPQSSQPGFVQPAGFMYAQPIVPTYAAAPQVDPHLTRHMSFVQPHSPYPPGYTGHTDIPDHHRTHSVSSPVGSHSGGYMQPESFRYADPNDTRFKQKKEEQQFIERGGKVYVKSVGTRGEIQYVEVKTAGRADKHDKREKHENHDKYDKHDRRDKKDRHGSPPSSDTLVPKMGRLAVAGAAGAGAGALLGVDHGHHSHGGSGKPPASPLLEAYRGTYQSISPMPSPMMIPGHYNDDDVSDLSSLEDSDSDSASDSDAQHHRTIKPRKAAKSKSTSTELALIGRKRQDSDVSVTEIIPSNERRRVTFYDPEKDAKALEKALNHHHVDNSAVIKILPHLTSDELLLLRNEYKKHAKVGGQGINIAKQIKMKLPVNLGKAAYATALGRWESEAYWANCWYQGGASRRELLIESLMGRSNSDIREIKRVFKDKKYDNDLEKCMKTELKADKFRSAILLALAEKRQAEGQGLNIDVVKNDVRALYGAVNSREGGETALINIIVVRSDSHLREIMRVYEANFKENFARKMISKSQNLVVSHPAVSAFSSSVHIRFLRGSVCIF